MTHKSRLSNWFVLAKFGIDCVLIPFIIVAAYVLKFKLGWVFQHFFSVSIGTEIYKKAAIEPYLKVLWLIVLVWLFTFYFSKVYRTFSGIMPEIEEIVAIVKGVSIATIEIMALSFLYKSFPESRYVVAYSWVLGIILLSLSRIGLHHLELYLLKKGKGLKKALIIGENDLGQDIAERLLLAPSLGYQYVGTLSETMPEYCHFHLKDQFNRLGSPEEFRTLIQKKDCEVVFVTTVLSPPLFEALTLFCYEKDIDLKWTPELGVLPGISSIEDYDGLLFVSCTFPKEGFGQAIKRLFDLVMSIIGLIVLAPLLFIIGVMIKIVSPGGPVLFFQERAGQNNQTFNMIKFRTMIPDAEKHTGPVMVSEKQETRYIRYGDFLRKTSLDELPQLFNVLKGDMSIVGPRPERPFFVEKFNHEIPHFSLRHKVKGGITGWAQVNGRSILTRQPKHKLRYDLYYIKNWSLLFDFKILLKTLIIVFKQEEAY